jgi:hypothetical protein
MRSHAPASLPCSGNTGYPSREETQNWLNAKEDEFVRWKTQGLRVNVEQWKDKYLYIDMHEIFFVEFPCLLNEWLKR